MRAAFSIVLLGLLPGCVGYENLAGGYALAGDRAGLGSRAGSWLLGPKRVDAGVLLNVEGITRSDRFPAEQVGMSVLLAGRYRHTEHFGAYAGVGPAVRGTFTQGREYGSVGWDSRAGVFYSFGTVFRAPVVAFVEVALHGAGTRSRFTARGDRSNAERNRKWRWRSTEPPEPIPEPEPEPERPPVTFGESVSVFVVGGLQVQF